jgi:hypothetical protein
MIRFLLPILGVVALAGCTGQDGRVHYPITEATGLYTIRVGFYNSLPRKGIDAVTEANEAADALRRAGHEAYVTDLKTLAIVTVGSYDSRDDPRMKALWQRFYEAWERKAGRTTLGMAQRELEKWYGEDTPLGNRPWPTPVITLQYKMKTAQGTLTEADEQRYRNYLESLRKEREKAAQ